VLAAKRAGVKTLLLPEENRKDVLEDVPAEIQDGMTFIYVKDISQVLELALEPPAKSARDRRA